MRWCTSQTKKRVREMKTRHGIRGGKLFVAILPALVFASVLLGSAAAKDRQPTTRVVSGTVFDDAQKAIFGATVELTDQQTGKVLDIYSQESGDYQYSDLRFDHDYTIKAMYKGASSEVRKVSMFDTRWHLVFNLTVSKPTK
jgi:hypothetical protein